MEETAEEERILAPPMIVHCSAGVGRTGALILAETALELLARRQPLYPLDLVRAMRTQRPMCIQNAVSVVVSLALRYTARCGQCCRLVRTALCCAVKVAVPLVLYCAV